MNSIRKIVESNKGLVTFMLVLFFLTAGFAKSLSVKIPVSKGDAKKSYAKQIVSVENEDESSKSFLSSFPDSDADDADLIFFQNYNTPNFLVAETAGVKHFTTFALLSQGYDIPLYDLYCNWKFDLV